MRIQVSLTASPTYEGAQVHVPALDHSFFVPAELLKPNNAGEFDVYIKANILRHMAWMAEVGAPSATLDAFQVEVLR